MSSANCASMRSHSGVAVKDAGTFVARSAKGSCLVRSTWDGCCRDWVPAAVVFVVASVAECAAAAGVVSEAARCPICSLS